MRILDILALAFCGFFALFGLFNLFIALFGLRRDHPHFSPASACKRIAVLIAARNEEGVIGDAVTQLLKQNYPKKLYDIYVIANNCTDNTAQAARDAGAIVMLPDVPIHMKADALRFAFDKLALAGYDAYCIFDADNLVDPDFLKITNDALCAGARVAQGYRDAKNPYVNWLTGGMTIFFLFMNRLYNQARSALKLSAQLNGTGFMIASSLVNEIGFETHSLTEDLEYSAQCALHGERIWWMRKAITYDEHPTTLRASLSQRRRWFGGSWQCLRPYFKPLVRKGSVASIDMALVFSGVCMQLIGILSFFITVLSQVLRLLNNPSLLVGILIPFVLSILSTIVSLQVFSLFVCLLEKKSIRRMAFGILLFPLFMFTWMFANLSCVLTGPPKKWHEIKHGTKKSG